MSSDQSYKRLVSVLTAVHSSRARWLPETADSLASQLLPPGFTFEWIIQEDGDHSIVPELIAERIDPTVVNYGSNLAAVGTAITRNLALSRAQGDYLISLDADDILFRSALHTLLANWTSGIRAPGSQVGWSI